MISQLKGIERVSQAGVLVDSLTVVEKVIIDFKSYCHGSMMDQLKLHQVFIAAPIEIPHIVVLRRVVSDTVFLQFAWRVSACVGEAGLLYEPKILGILSCDEVWEATITALSILAARHNFLRTQDWGLRIVGKYSDS